MAFREILGEFTELPQDRMLWRAAVSTVWQCENSGRPTLTAKTAVLRAVRPCSLAVGYRSGGTDRLHLQGNLGLWKGRRQAEMTTVITLTPMFANVLIAILYNVLILMQFVTKSKVPKLTALLYLLANNVNKIENAHNGYRQQDILVSGEWAWAGCREVRGQTRAHRTGQVSLRSQTHTHTHTHTHTAWECFILMSSKNLYEFILTDLRLSEHRSNENVKVSGEMKQLCWLQVQLPFGTEVAISCSQQLATGVYPQPVSSNSRIHTPFIKDPL
jgi:hypothetical protein